MSLRTFRLSRWIWQKKFPNFLVSSFGSQNYEDYRNNNYYYGHKNIYKIYGICLGSIFVGSHLADQGKNKQNEIGSEKNIESFEAGEKRPDLPTYRAEEVSKHDNKNSFWVTYRHGVYDVTKFLPLHPGAEQIYNAAGLSIEPFWNVYGMHKTEQVYRILEEYRIGNLHDDDIVDHSDDELWAKEPFRDKRLLVKTMKPFNAEIPPKLQINSLDTPNELFYVRQHMPVPDLDPANHKFKVIIKNGKTKTKEFSLDVLKSFPQVSVRAALMCAGNRRSEMDKVKPVKGLSWTGGAISNAVWSGVYLRDVLLASGLDVSHVEGKHVIFTGADVDATGVNFSTSMPLAMVLDPSARVLLATHMNGEPLPPDHGRPLRVVVPGAPAVRSVKWLESITVSDEESPSHWHQKDYRSFNASTTWETADFASAPPVYMLPVTSAICDPIDGETVEVKGGLVEIKGYAYSGAGAKILRVDLTSDSGATWRQAELIAQDSAPPREHYSWTLWRALIPVDKNQKEMHVWAKATDSNFNTQPEKFDDIWNIRGILANAYHKIKIKLRHIN